MSGFVQRWRKTTGLPPDTKNALCGESAVGKETLRKKMKALLVETEPSDDESPSSSDENVSIVPQWKEKIGHARTENADVMVLTSRLSLNLKLNE